jgi:hypothetical protein
MYIIKNLMHLRESTTPEAATTKGLEAVQIL